MNGNLPADVQRGAGLLIFALAALLVAAYSVLATLAVFRATLTPRARTSAPWLVAGYLGVWLAAALVTGDGANFPLANPDRRLAISVTIGFGPMFLAFALLAGSQTVRALNDAMQPEWLIFVQSYRMAGLMFLFPFLYFGAVPAAFAVPAALGDFLTGLAAPFVGVAVARRYRRARALAVAWNLFGLLDLTVAPAAALLSRAGVVAIYPLALVPLFLGPPLGILTHVLSLRNLARRPSLEAETEGAVS
jgi:hypothetical protein